MRNWRGAGIALLLPLVGACDERGTAPSTRLDTPVQVSAALTGSAVAWLSVEVTGSDIAVPIVVTLDATGSTAHGTVTVPSGAARIFTARGYDTEGTLTHRAVSTKDVTPGSSNAVSLVLLPTTDGSGATYREDVVSLSSGSVTLSVGETWRPQANVTHADGSAVESPTIVWATLDPSVATVSRTGYVTAIAQGITQIVAMSGGGAAIATVVVQ